MKNQKARDILAQSGTLYSHLYTVVNTALANHFNALHMTEVRTFLNSSEGVRFKDMAVSTMLRKKYEHTREVRQVDDILILRFTSAEDAVGVLAMMPRIFEFLKDEFSLTIKAFIPRHLSLEIICSF